MGSTFKPIGGSKVDSTFHPFKVDKGNTKLSWGLVVKGAYVLVVSCSLAVSEPHHTKSAYNIYLELFGILGKVSV